MDVSTLVITFVWEIPEISPLNSKTKKCLELHQPNEENNNQDDGVPEDDLADPEPALALI